jgi:hypothetical protein
MAGSSTTISKALARSAVLALTVLAAGCGGPSNMARVTGVVTYNGTPVAGAKVMFDCPGVSARTAVGVTDASGEFVLSTFAPGDGAVIGRHRVAVSPFSDEAVAAMSPAQQQALGRGGRVPGVAGGGMPTRYASFDKSGLTATVEAGKDNRVRFDLTD